MLIRIVRFLQLNFFLYLDQNLNFKHHINQINSRISKSLFSIRRVKNVLTPVALKSLYYSLIHSHIVYAIQIYSCAPKSIFKPLILNQKAAVRCITNSRYNAHTGPLFKKLGILPFEKLVQFFQLKFIRFVIIWLLDPSKTLGLLTSTGTFY